MEKNKENLLALEAWDEWKTSCAVNLCSEEKRSILQKELYVAVIGKKGSKTGILEKLNLPEEFIEEVHARFSGNNNDEFANLANEFDANIKLHEDPGSDTDAVIFKSKAWKDFVWSKLKDPNNLYPKLQTIHSYLINNTEKNWYKSVLFYFIKDFLEKDYSCKIIQKQNLATGKKYYKVIWNESLTIKDDEEGESRQRDVVSDLLHPDNELDVDEEDRKKLEKELDNCLSDEECVLIFFELLRVPVYENETIKYALNMGKSRMNELKKNALGKLKKIKEFQFSDFFSEMTEEEINMFALEYLCSRLKRKKMAWWKICRQVALLEWRKKRNSQTVSLASAKTPEKREKIQRSIFFCENIISTLEG